MSDDVISRFILEFPDTDKKFVFSKELEIGFVPINVSFVIDRSHLQCILVR